MAIHCASLLVRSKKYVCEATNSVVDVHRGIKFLECNIKIGRAKADNNAVSRRMTDAQDGSKPDVDTILSLHPAGWSCW